MTEPLSSDAWRKTPAKKDTRKWCKGKVGREHEWGLRKRRYLEALNRSTRCHFVTGSPSFFAQPDGWMCYHERYCVNCGKVDWHDPIACPEHP